MAQVESPDLRPVVGRVRVWYPQVGSTMDIAAGLAARGAPHGSVVQTGYQSAGRGRMGRAWQTEPGAALLTSWILRGSPAPEAQAVLSPLIALALVRAARHLAPAAPVGYKWPNDVLIDDRKLAGILLTSRLMAGESVIIAGIGVNVGGATERSSDRTSLSEWTEDVSIDRMRDVLAVQLDRVWEAFQVHPALGEADRHELETLMCWTDEHVSVIAGIGDVTGRIVGLATDGALRIRPVGGQEMTLRIGEIVRGPRRIPEKPADRYRILS